MAPQTRHGTDRNFIMGFKYKGKAQIVPRIA